MSEERNKDRDVIFKEMFEELQYVWDWYSLGLSLGIPLQKLKMIEYQHRELSKQKIEMLDAWFQIVETPCWLKFGQALSKLPDHRSEGDRILREHCDPRPPPPPRCTVKPPSGAYGGSLFPGKKPAIPPHIVPRVPSTSLRPRNGSGKKIMQINNSLHL